MGEIIVDLFFGMLAVFVLLLFIIGSLCRMVAGKYSIGSSRYRFFSITGISLQVLTAVVFPFIVAFWTIAVGSH